MGRRKKAKAAAQAAAVAGQSGPLAPQQAHLDRGQLADCLSQTSKIAAECNSILRDLLRGRSPQHQDLQRLASQVLMGQSLGLTDLQRKMESQQATLAELLKMLKPAAGGAAGVGADGDASTMLASYAPQQPSLSIVKGWDALNLLAAPARRRKGQQKVDRRQDGAGAGGTKRERCFGVESYWRQLPPAQRRQLLRAPLGKMAEAVRAEQGEEGVRDLAEALALLRQQGGRSAAHWRCPCCDTRLLDAGAFAQHVRLYHEEVQYTAEGAAVQCTKCMKEVVGAHYQNEEPGFPTVVLCMSCCWDEQILQAAGGDDSGSAMQLRVPAPGQRLLPPGAGGAEGGNRWSWLEGAQRGGAAGALGGADSSGSSSEESSSEDYGRADGDGGDGDGGEDVRWSGQAGARSAHRRHQLQLQQQVAAQVHGSGGLLAAVARRLDDMARGMLVPVADTGGSGAAAAAQPPFDQVLLGMVGEAQQLLSVPGAEVVAAPDEQARLELQVQLAAPEAFPDQQEHLKAAVRQLSSQELQCLLGYIITKHGAALGPRSAPAGTELLSSSAAAAAASALSAGYASAGEGDDDGSTSTGGGSDGGSGSDGYCTTPDLGSPTAAALGAAGAGAIVCRPPGDLHAEQQHAAAPAASYDPGCASVFALASGPEGAAAGAGAELLRQQLAALAAQPGSLVQELAEGRCLTGGECLEPHPWWIDHLSHKSWHDFPGDGAAEVYLLQWVYGNVAHAPTEDFLERQRLAAGSKGCDAAVMDCLAELADVWRQLAAATARKRHLQSLRNGVREEAAAVRSFEEAGAAALRTQAAEFFDEVGGSGSGGDGGGGGVHWSQRALGKLQRFHQLKDESSIRYAQALIDREVAVLELAEEMDLHELGLAAAEVASIEAALGDARRGVGDAEAERARLAAEGPAAHRKKDLLDKVNKEAEHRERLQELQQRIAAGQERIFSEEGFLADARKRHDELAADLDEVRAEMAAFLERRAALDKACHDVLSAQERDRDQQLTDAHVDQRIRAVWQVVTCVADAIRLLHDRYAPDAQSREAERHIRCTGQAQGLCDDIEERLSAMWGDLDRLRRRAVDLACCDAGAVVEAAALEVIRTQLEDAAVAAREAATLDLLRELELEEAAKKAAEQGKKGKKKKKKGGKAAEEEEDAEEEAGGAGTKAAAAAAARQDDAGAGRSGSGGGGGEARGTGGAGVDAGDGSGMEVGGMAAAAQQLLSSLEQVAPELRAELEYEAALERRRQELEAERLRKEQEMMRMAQEASLLELQLQQQQALLAATAGKAGKAASAKGGSAAPNNGAASAKGAAAAAAAPGPAGKSPTKSAPASPAPAVPAVAAAAGGSRSAPGTPGKVKAAGAAAAASTGGRVITVAVAALRSGSKAGQPSSPPPAGVKSPAKPAAAAAATAAAAAPPAAALPAAVPPVAVKAAAPPAAPAAAAAAGSAQPGGPHEMRVISYYGDWRCFCGEVNRLWDTCVCGQIPPCRDWVRGRCTYKTRCRFAHPPFELPESLPRPKSPIAKPSPEALVYTKGSTGPARTASKAAAVPQPVATPEAPAVVATPRVVSVPAAGKGGTGGRVVQLVKPGGRGGGSGAAAAAGKAAGAPADTAPPPPLKPAPWANVRPGSTVPPPAPLAAAQPPAGPLEAAVPAAEAAPLQFLQSAPATDGAVSSFSLFGGSNPLLSALGGGGAGGGEPVLAGLGAEASASTELPGLGAFSSSSSLFGPGSMFSPAPSPAAGTEAHQGLLGATAGTAAASVPLSPSRLGAGSVPQSPLLLSPQHPRLAGAPQSPAAPAFLQSPAQPASGLAGALGDLPLGAASPAVGTAGAAGAGLDLPGLAAFQHSLQQQQLPPASLPFGGAGSGGLPFGDSPLLGGFGALGAHASAALGGFSSGGLGLGSGGGEGTSRMDDWTDLHQQLPSDLGAMLLGSDPVPSPQQSPLKAQPSTDAGGSGGGSGSGGGGGSGGLYGGSGTAPWF